VQSLTSEDLASRKRLDLSDTLFRRLASVNVTRSQSNPWQNAVRPPHDGAIEVGAAEVAAGELPETESWARPRPRPCAPQRRVQWQAVAFSTGAIKARTPAN
jgi:hypothetical protein